LAMAVDTWLATRPGFKTPAFNEFRDQLLGGSNIAAASDAAA